MKINILAWLAVYKIKIVVKSFLWYSFINVMKKYGKKSIVQLRYIKIKIKIIRLRQ